MSGLAEETREHRLKRLRLRSWRRGIKEMDLILGRFADAELEGLSADDLDRYEALIAEDDQTLYTWVSLRAEAPSTHDRALTFIREFHNLR